MRKNPSASPANAAGKRWLEDNTAELAKAVSTVQDKTPVVLNLTNDVSMDIMANALLAAGSAPIMSKCDQELEELIKISSAVNINIGTLDEAFILRAQKA